MIVYFVEHLTFRSWCASIFPRILWNRFAKGLKAHSCYVIDCFRVTFLFARASARLAGVTLNKFAFRFVDVRDESGLLLRLRIQYRDVADVQADALAEPAFLDFAKSVPRKGRLLAYLAKGLATGVLSIHGPRKNAVFLVQICAWKTRTIGIKYGGAILFVESRPWIRVIERYAARHGVTVVPVCRSIRLEPRALVRRVLGPSRIEMLRALSYRVLRRWRRGVGRRSRDVGGVGLRHEPPAAKVAVEYLGHLNLNQPALHSDLFFWQRSALSGADVLVMFRSPLDGLDEGKWKELVEHGMSAVVLHPRATSLTGAPLFLPRLVRGGAPRSVVEAARSRSGLETIWLNERVADYIAQRTYWRELFEAHNVKVFVAWFKNDETHCAVADALEDLGGVTAIYQRSCELLPSAEMAVSTDVVFGFSQEGAEIERRSGSRIRYHVTTGYLRDHQFAFLREQARGVREALQRNGATRIVAYFDENSADDSRWHSGHEFMRENYAFLLEKLLAEPRLGLVLKPKVPGTLRRRLGPVAELLERARATGRCHVYEGGAIQGTYPPSAAALAADFAIQGHLCAATAGFESALAGVPTLLVDREGWSASPLYRLGVGRVVFCDWPGLWEACLQHWDRPGGLPGFGDWTPMLDELDPFRDGRAAERMGTYLQWLIEGFKGGLDRETVMADAAERYGAVWGKDKVTEVVSNGAALAASR